MNEMNTLVEGEIYCRTDKEVIIGKVTITRALTLHSEDVQVVNAVDVLDESSLNALHNCIMFSQQEQRDLLSQLSDDNLDENIYNVIYDSRLLSSHVVEPTDYSRVASKNIDRLITRKNIMNFFINFMKNDQLERIATIHTQLTDCSNEEIEHSDCIILTEMHSIAVNFFKIKISVCSISASTEQSLTTFADQHEKLFKVRSMSIWLHDF